MSEQYWGCLDKMSKVNFSPAETLYSIHYLFVIYFLHVPLILNSCGINFGNVFKRLRPSVKSSYQKKRISYFSNKTYIVGAQRNRLI